MDKSYSLIGMRDKIQETLSYKKRYAISNVIFVLLILLLYFGVFLGIIVSILFKYSSFFIILYISFFILFVIYRLFIPSKFEKFKYDLKELADSLEKKSINKRNLFRIVLQDLEKLSKKEKGFNKIVFDTLKNYFVNVLGYMIFSKKETSLKIIKEGLLDISNGEDIHSVYYSFVKLNKEVIKLGEFLNLLDVSLSFPKDFDVRDLHNPFKWIPKIINYPENKYSTGIKIIFNYLDQQGVTKIVLILLTVSLFGWGLDKLGLLDWAIKVIPTLIP